MLGLPSTCGALPGSSIYTTAPPEPTGPPMTELKPCWECSKKRRVCDFTRPHCRKCQSRGVDCPGYEKKPLKWLQPGQTRSKGKRARSEASDGSNESKCRAVASRLSAPPITAVLHFEGLAMVEGINYCRQTPVPCINWCPFLTVTSA